LKERSYLIHTFTLKCYKGLRRLRRLKCVHCGLDCNSVRWCSNSFTRG